MPALDALVPAALAALALAACAQQPNVSPGPGNLREAGRVLLMAAASGPVPLVVDQPPAGLAPGDPLAEVARLAREGAKDWANVTFAPTTDLMASAERPRVVMRFAQIASNDPAALCTGASGSDAAGLSPARLQAVVCDGARPVSDAIGIAAGPTSEDTERLVRRTTAALLPSYSGSGGRWGFPGVSVGVGVGGGSGGVGVGVGGIGLGF